MHFPVSSLKRKKIPVRESSKASSKAFTKKKRLQKGKAGLFRPAVLNLTLQQFNAHGLLSLTIIAYNILIIKLYAVIIFQNAYFLITLCASYPKNTIRSLFPVIPYKRSGTSVKVSPYPTPAKGLGILKGSALLREYIFMVS